MQIKEAMIMTRRYVETIVERCWREIKKFRKMWEEDKPAAIFLVAVLAIYVGFIILPPILGPAIPPTMASPTVELDQENNAGKIRKP